MKHVCVWVWVRGYGVRACVRVGARVCAKVSIPIMLKLRGSTFLHLPLLQTMSCVLGPAGGQPIEAHDLHMYRVHVCVCVCVCVCVLVCVCWRVCACVRWW